MKEVKGNWNQFYLNLKNIREIRQNAPFPVKNSRNTLGRGTAFSPNPIPTGEGIPLLNSIPRTAKTVGRSIKQYIDESLPPNWKSRGISCALESCHPV